MIRLIATDMDDTLLDASSSLTERTRCALQKAMDAGCMISLSSGRMTESMLPFAEKIGVNAPMILYNGALIYDHRTGETLFSNPIPADIALGVAKMIESMGVYLQIYPGEGYYCNRRCAHTDRYEASIRVTCQEVGMPVSEWMHSDMVKMLAIADPQVIAQMKETLRAAFPGVNFMTSKPHYLEIVAEGVDKGSTLKVLGELLGLERNEIMAFGDGQNDATMVACAGWGVAMDNACAECKAGAKIIAPANTEDGVAQVIEAYLDR
jgi:Cof subfamily protein (haloacid dehalogenase superfamily)